MKIDQAKIRDLPKELASTSLSNRVSLFQEKNRYEVTYIKIESIRAFKHQTRKIFNDDELTALAETIKTHGIRQPLTLLGKEDDTFEVVSGERRLRAAKLAGLQKVPAIIVYDEKASEEIAFVENIHRSDLSLLELGDGLSGLIERGVFSSQSEIARKLGISRTKVTEAIGLTVLPLSIRKLINEHKVNNRDFLRELVAAATETQQKELIESRFVLPRDHHKTLDDKKLVRKTSKSILRIIKDHKGIRIQNFDGSILDSHEKALIREFLGKIIDSLE